MGQFIETVDRWYEQMLARAGAQDHGADADGREGGELAFGFGRRSEGRLKGERADG